MIDLTGSQAQPLRTWQQISRVVTAHVVMLRDAGVFDDPVLAALLSGLDGVGRASPPPGGNTVRWILDFDERLDAVTPPGAVGGAAVGRATADVVAAVSRIGLRQELLETATALANLRQGLHDLARAHVTTQMPAYAGSQPVQPTTFGHFLGGIIGPLTRAAANLPPLYAEVNRSPLGAATMVSGPIAVDRERVAGLLGFDDLIANTFDAVAAVDHVASIASWAETVAAAIRRFLDELLVWLRTEPGSFRLDERWTAFDLGLPGWTPPAAIECLIQDARRIEGLAGQARTLAHASPFAPVTNPDRLLEPLTAALTELWTLLDTSRDLFTTGIEVNRAYLATRAGRGHVTSGDLTQLLIDEEGIEPATARAITALTVRRAKEEGLEASGITSDMIDAAALMHLGRDLGIEFEVISRYLAPRRYLDRRQATGGPSAAATRAYLDQVQSQLATDQRWQQEAEGRLTTAAAELDDLVQDMLAKSE
ncbi:MAG: lyase family protein [Thermomicrobiales bacterium]